jgi:hypothetical protein
MGHGLGVREGSPYHKPEALRLELCRRIQLLFRSRISAARYAPTQAIGRHSNRHSLQKSGADRRPARPERPQIHMPQCGHIDVRAASDSLLCWPFWCRVCAWRELEAEDPSKTDLKYANTETPNGESVKGTLGVKYQER